MQKNTICRCCGQQGLFRYLDLGRQPLANSYHKGESQPTYPLQVSLCLKCFHSQLSVVVNPRVMFDHYLYVSGTTTTFQKHCENLVQEVTTRIRPPYSVLDIACNDGTLLDCFRKLGYFVCGVDPAKNLRFITRKKKISVIVDYWSIDVAKKINRKFTIITAQNVFAHVDDAKCFLEACRYVLDPDGLVLIEFPYCDNMIRHNEFDTIYHEHLSYFLVHSFMALCDRTGFVIDDIIQTPIHGGSIRFFLKAHTGLHSVKAYSLIKTEEKMGLRTKQTYITFAQHVERNKLELRKRLTSLIKSGRRIIGYGASAKGNTMLNYFHVDLDYIVDDNPMKWGYQTPGRNIPIMHPGRLQEESHNLAIIVLSWNFLDEILEKIKMLRGRGHEDVYMLYVPTVEVKPL